MIGGQRKEITGDLLQDEFLQPSQIVQTEVRGLAHGGQEGLFRVGALDLDQSSQGAYTATAAALLEGTRWLACARA